MIDDGKDMYGKVFPHLRKDDEKYKHTQINEGDLREPHYINEQPEKFIAGFYFKDKTICDKLIDWHLRQNDKVLGKFGSGEINKDRKDSIETEFWPDNGDIEVVNYFKELQTCLKNIFPLYPELNMTTPWSISTATNVQQYPIGGGYKVNHFERDCFTSTRRFLVYMTYLNDVPDGGTYWKYQNTEIKAEKGLTVFWPTDWTHVHKGVVSNTTEKFIATGWYSFDEVYPQGNNTVYV